MAKDKKKKQSLFDHLNAVKKSQDPDYWSKLSERDKKTWSTFMINRFLSMNPDLVDIINELQHLTALMEDRHVYRMLIEILPAHSGYHKYISAHTKKGREWVVDMIADYFQVSKREAEGYYVVYKQSGDPSDLLMIADAIALEDDKKEEIKKLIK